MQEILVTGGAGFIGSHTCISLIESGYQVIIADDLSNSKLSVLSRIEEITRTKITFYQVDICDEASLDRIFQKHDIAAVIHFAGKKAVGESVRIPLAYYRTNLYATISLCRAMQRNRVFHLVFSSSATVYGAAASIPYSEETQVGTCTSPYGWTKWMNEQILRDLCVSDSKFSISLLRYFNPVGAHPSGRMGEDPSGIPNNLVPYITQVAVGRRKELTIFGNDYDTPDGTCIRDYIHVMDVAEGHVAALCQCLKTSGSHTYNLGSGVGYSVLQVLRAFEKVVGKDIPYSFGPRREGDLPAYFAATDKARSELGWQASRSLQTICTDTWTWQKNNPNGYD